MDEHAGDVVQPIQATQQLSVLEEAAVAPEVGDETGEAEPEASVVVARVVVAADVGVLPRAPVARGLARGSRDRDR